MPGDPLTPVSPELERRGIELATREAEERTEEIRRLLSSRRVVRMAREDERVADARLALLEQLSFGGYPRPSLLVAARELHAACRAPRVWPWSGPGRALPKARTGRRRRTLVLLGAALATVVLVVAGAHGLLLLGLHGLSRIVHGVVDRPPLLALLAASVAAGAVKFRRAHRQPQRRSGRSGGSRRAVHPSLEEAVDLVSELCPGGSRPL